jgi:hypothetical protein
MTEYDLGRREQIRDALLAYMKEHGIGVPRLAQRIKEKVHRSPVVPVKTLQRFMKGEVRTIDQYVGFLAQFVENVSAMDSTPRLGSALKAFYSSDEKDDWSGDFLATEEIPAGSVVSKIEIRRDQGVWRVKETSLQGGPHRIYDGAMTCSARILIVVLKDRLTGLPRMITASANGGRDFEGGATAASFPDPLATLPSHFRVTTRVGPIALRR